jgi:hypothetical protein
MLRNGASKVVKRAKILPVSQDDKENVALIFIDYLIYNFVKKYHPL